MASDDSDEDLVLHGTPLAPLEEDAPVKKPVSTEDQVVTDGQGRRRFHGAFTGGFSAGYYNTVDTPEGWTPATFVSSRSSKAGKVQQRPEDFMDDEDMGEFGIAPKTVTTTREFLSEGKEDVRRKRAAASADQHGITALLHDLIIPARESIGVRLLRKMGWRHGAGIGAKVRRKVKMKRQAEAASSQRTYGCAPPPGYQHSEEEEDEDDPFAQGLEFAPKDVLPMSYQPKDNMHGIGYRGLVPTDFLEPSCNVSHSTARSGPRGKGIKGQAFGVGAFEEEDADIYTTDSMANYDFSAAGVEVDTHTHKQTRHGHPVSSIEAKAPEGFLLSARAAEPKQVFPPPVVPRDFKPLHTFSSTERGETRPGGRHTLTALQRAQALGEKPPTEQMSVFDLISTADKEAIKTAQLQKHVPAAAPAPPEPPAAPAVHADRQALHQSEQTTATTAGNFRPFSRDAAKQQRYEEYVRAAKSAAKDPMPATPPGMTEWEREREREEFVRAYRLYQPLHGMMADRFTREKHQGQPHTPSQEGEVSDKAQAAGMKMFGRLTRDRMEWHPDKLLCRRFNVPNPYPESTVVGLCTLRKEKYTFANFLNMSVESSSSGQAASTATNSTEKETPARSQEVNKTVGGGEGRGVLSYLCESEDVPSVSGQDNLQEGVSKEQEKDGDKPQLDLFKAIFQSSSDSSGGSEDSEEGDDVDDARGGGGETRGVGAGGKRVEEDGNPVSSEQEKDRPVLPQGNKIGEPADTAKLDMEARMSVVMRPESHGSRRDRSEPGEHVRVEQTQFYGPTLPPKGGVSTSPARPPTDAPPSHRHKHSQRDKHRHKHKKDKKSKKSKHKHKKKSKKKRRWKDEGEDSGSERESSEESEDEGKADLLNDQLLHRVRSLRHHITPADIL